MKIENIKTPQDILEFMNETIEYGWIDKNGKKHIKTMKNFRKDYITQSIDETLNNCIDCCVEQVFLMHFLLDKINIKNKMFCCRIYEPDDYDNLEEDEHMHCFILYYLNNKVYHIEHPNFEKIGIYEYNSQFYDVLVGPSFKEFNNYINNLDINKIL